MLDLTEGDVLVKGRVGGCKLFGASAAVVEGVRGGRNQRTLSLCFCSSAWEREEGSIWVPLRRGSAAAGAEVVLGI